MQTIGGILLVGALVWWAHPYFGAEQRMRAVCAQIQPGMTLNELRLFASEHGLNDPHIVNGVAFVVEHRTFGRYGCRVTFAAQLVKSAEYNFAD